MILPIVKPGISAAFAGVLLLFASAAVAASNIKIVAIGASNTSGWGVLPGQEYPARLQEMLRSKGIRAQVINAGMPFNTTAGMLGRIDAAVPNGTRLVILQPGANDLRFGHSKAQRSGNIAAMVRRLNSRGIKVIVFDPVIPPQYYQWDRIHLSAEGHAMFASELLPQVLSAIER